MLFDRLVKVYQELEDTASGNELRKILAGLFSEVKPEEIAKISYLTLGRISSDYSGIVLGLAEKTVIKAIAKVGGISESKAKVILNETGDIGLAAEKILKKKPQTLIPMDKLTVIDLFSTLHKITTMSGSGSQDVKMNLLVNILQKASPAGAKYLSRIVLGTLRLGVAEMAVLDSLSIAFTGDKKNKEILENAYNICPDLGIIAETLAIKGIKSVEKINIQVGRPIKMMLAQRIGSLDELSKKMPGKVSVEGKYDGERIQAHYDKNGLVSLFSRRLDTNTSQFPDLVKYIKEQIGLKNKKDFIVEGEVLAIDSKGNPLPFQTLMQRRRKHDIEKYVKDVPVQFKIFDILYFDGKQFFDEPYQKRIDLLKKIVHENKNIKIADRIETDNIAKINLFFSNMLKSGYEGIMIKSLSGTYQAGVRGWNWIKWKKEYVTEMVDTFDLVIVGAFYGRGRRSGVYGALLCAVYNAKEDTFETVCKLGTGLTDEVLASIPKTLEPFKIDHKPARLQIKKEMIPDIWFTPELVVEVLAAELTKSPFHSAGVALRFPRFLKFRDDKKAEQATTKKELNEIV
jgi:DNA ligase 1